MGQAAGPERRGSIVDEHERLVNRIDSIDRGLRVVPVDGHRVILALKDVLELTRAHFEHEEGVMAVAKYHDFAAHKRDHDYLRTSLIHYIEMVEHRKLPIPPDLGINLKSWLEFHIKKFDDPYFHFATRGN